MATKRLRRRINNTLVILALGLGIISLLLLSQTAQNSEEFGRLQGSILVANSLCAAVLLGLIVGNLVRLIRDYRNETPGARLKGRMVITFASLVIVPLLVVYLFAVQFLNRGIDTWFDVPVEQGLEDALALSRSVLNLRMRDNMRLTVEMGQRLARVQDKDIYPVLATLRQNAGAEEVTLLGRNYRIVATSASTPVMQLPDLPNWETLLRLRQQNSYVGLEPKVDGGYRIRAAILMLPTDITGEPRILQALYDVGEELGPLAVSVQSTFTRYGELVFLREPLKYSFTLSLSLVLLLSLLGAAYGAFFFSRRLVAPIQTLVDGTRAVAKGDFDTRLPPGSADEIGFLIDSFNDMIEQLGEARAEASRSEQQVEEERTNLEVILAGLSTGVIALERNRSIRIANAAADTILGGNLSQRAGESMQQVAEGNSELKQFVEACEQRLNSGETDWRDQIVLKSEGSRRVLVCASAALPGGYQSPGGVVIVFDDMTELMQAQRDAAWGEVARRLAHEIKNPLTPIQLSAERIRRKYLNEIEGISTDLLDRATTTIVQQVEAMRDMVNAFSEYARAPQLHIVPVNLHQLIAQVADLYPSHGKRPRLELSFDSNIEMIDADSVRLRQVLHNLIRNALEAMEDQEGAVVELETRLSDSEKGAVAEIIVGDNGPGFPEEGQEEVFEPYVTSKDKGTGLGLAIVKKLIEEHGGEVTVENKEGAGARVRICIPIKEGTESGSATSGHSSEPRRQPA
ncbi:MAG: ATP-binding protein [Gammaproteobacteria bacterium]